MKNINSHKFKASLRKYQIEDLAWQTGFKKRCSGKIDAPAFLIGFFQMVLSGHYSLRNWASQISLIIGDTVSPQAIANKLQFRQLHFVHQLFLTALQSKFQKQLQFDVIDILKPFKRVILEDSSCFGLPKNLFEFFPGARLPFGRLAGGRVQLRLFLKSNTYEGVSLKSYCQNDLSYAQDILSIIQRGDLVIRDLGYWLIPALRKIHDMGAYFLSRMNLSSSVYYPDKKLINLVDILKRKERQGVLEVDMNVLLTRKHMFPVRLVAMKLSEQNAMKRRKMAKNNRHKNTPISKKSMYLLGWNIFVTNVDKPIWNLSCIYQVYNLRWHIEMIFKCWKSKFNFVSLFKNCQGRNPAKPEMLLMLILSWLVMFYVPLFNHYANRIAKAYNKFLSPLKFADFIKTHFHLFNQNRDFELIELLAYYSCYNKRKDRKNHFEKLYMNFLS